MALSNRIGAGFGARRLLEWALFMALSAGCSQKQIYLVRSRISDSQGESSSGLKGGAIEFEAVYQGSVALSAAHQT